MRKIAYLDVTKEIADLCLDQERAMHDCLAAVDNHNDAEIKSCSKRIEESMKTQKVISMLLLHGFMELFNDAIVPEQFRLTISADLEKRTVKEAK